MQLGNLNLMILKSISESEKYGLEIIDDISQKTNGKTIVKQPSLYSGLRRLEQRGLISSRWEDSDIGGRRHYYAITNLGASELRSHDTTNLFSEGPEEQQDKKAQQTEDEKVVPSEVKTENVFESKEDVAKQDEQMAFDLEKSFDDDLEKVEQHEPTLMEQIAKDLDVKPDEEYATINPQPEQNKQDDEQFAAYDPAADNESKPQSFSENMKEYVEPENVYEELDAKQDFSASQEEQPEQAEVKQEQPEQKNNFDSQQETVVEYVEEKPASNDEINYKDILGDLDADLNKQPTLDGVYEETPIVNETKMTQKDVQAEQQEQTAERPKSAYQKELEEILLSSKQDDATHNLTIKETDRMAEVNRRYGEGKMGSVEADEIVEDETFDENIHKIAPKDVGFTYINQDDITVKPYKKAKKNKSNSTGLFLNVNRYNLIRASIMFVLMALELALSYVICNACGLFVNLESTAVLLYSISIAIAVLYFCISLIYTLSNISKKIKTDNISFAKEFLYRFIMCAFVVLFVFGLNIFMGMPNTISWLIPCIMAINILISWLVGLIMYKTKNFHA